MLIIWTCAPAPACYRALNVLFPIMAEQEKSALVAERTWLLEELQRAREVGFREHQEAFFICFAWFGLVWFGLVWFGWVGFGLVSGRLVWLASLRVVSCRAVTLLRFR